MRDESEDKRERLDAAKAAVPYWHARLSSTELSSPGKQHRSSIMSMITDEMRARRVRVVCAEGEGEGRFRLALVRKQRTFLDGATPPA